MAVPLLDLRPQNLPLEEELVAAFRRVLASGHYIMGPELDAFETAAARHLGVRHALGVSSGTDAILLALMGLGIGPGDEIIVPSFTFFATAGCVARLGATPVFADACPVCFNLDVRDVPHRITPRTRAVMPVHLFGQAANLSGVLELAKQHQLRVIEDAAQAFGADYRGTPVGGFGDFGTFSFFPSKNLGALGDAGLLTTNDDALADQARLLRVHGARPKYHHHVVGANFRMDPLQAAFLSAKLPRLTAYNEGRRTNAADYTARLSGIPGVCVADPAECACHGPGSASRALNARLILPVALPSLGHIWNQYTVRVPGPGRREALRAHLAGRGIGSEIYYPIPLHRQRCFAPAAKEQPEPLPISDQLSAEVLSLPIFPELTPDQRDEIVGAVAQFVQAGH